jgi:hypothetical protein
MFRTAGHNRQGAGDGPDFAARNRRINEIDTCRREVFTDLACGGRGDGAHVDGDQPGLAGSGDRTHDLGDIRRIGHHGDHQFVATGGFGRIGRRLGAGSSSGCMDSARRAQTVRPVATLEQIERHRAPHDAEADKSNIHSRLRSELPLVASLTAEFGSNVGRPGAAVKVTLNAITAALVQEVGLPLGFDSFGDN